MESATPTTACAHVHINPDFSVLVKWWKAGMLVGCWGIYMTGPTSWKYIFCVKYQKLENWHVLTQSCNF